MGGEQKRFLRMDTLGDNYSPEVLRAVIKGQKKHTPKKKKEVSIGPARNSGNLIIDIQKIVDQKKGPAYENWAKRYNMKQASETLLFLQEHNLTSLAELSDRAAAAASAFNANRKRNKELEFQLQRNAVLQKHIGNYSDTRAVYVEYQKSNYSPSFKADHEADILLHEAARKHFDELGLSSF